MKKISNFLNEDINNKYVIKLYNKMYKDTSIITIPNFISSDILENIKSEIENYKWWSYSIVPENDTWNVKYTHELTHENKIELFDNLEKKNFCYRFKRSTQDHFHSCYCISCRLSETICGDEVKNLLCKIVGCKKLKPGEVFLSSYSKDDFLSLHHDKNKGDLSVTFSLTYDWDPTYGGILHFCDEDKNIYKSIVPTLGSVNIFKLDPQDGITHFVSCVNVDKNRYTLTAWYYIVE
jgi:hypothetical protein